MKQTLENYILVVDDETSITRMCERFLTRVGYQVLTTNFPTEALGFLKTKEIALLLVDIRMPKMDGFQIMKHARKNQPDIAVVTMTGYGTVETAVESLRQGADGMLLKPFSGAELVQSIEQALRERQMEREMVRLQALRPLFSISEQLFLEKSPEQLRKRLLELVSQNLICSHVSFYQRMPDSNNWEKLASVGKPIDFIQHWPQQYNLLELCSFSLEDIEDTILVDYFQSNGMGYFFCVPLNSDNAQRVMFGARDIANVQLGEVELETLRILTRQAIVALENAQLYDELQVHIRQVEESQRALIQAEKMAAVGRLTASIAHEINNPLHSVQNCLHLARRQELPVEDRNEYLEMAADEMERLMSTVRQMLDFYRPSALDRKPVNINMLIDQVLKLLEKQLCSSQIEIIKQFDTNLPMVLVVDNQIQQVFFNLILNAMEAMPTGGEILVKTITNQEDISVVIKDTGIGIDDEHREDIFEPFVSYKEKGLGLGLTISYGVVTAHGGSLELMPASEGGACFRLSLPVY